MPTKKVIQPGETVPLRLTAAERKRILEDLLCLDGNCEQIIHATPIGKPVMMTLDDLDDLGGYIAAEANHCEDKKKQDKLEVLFQKTQDLLDRYTDENDKLELEGATMTQTTKKMSEMMKEMAEQLLRHPDADHSSEAAHVALMFANMAWNETVGLGHHREGYRSAWEMIEAENPEMWNELKSNDVDAMIGELIEYKRQHFPDDRRRILTCGMPEGKIRVEWLPAVAPGVDSKWEMHLHGLVRTGEREQAIEFLRETRRLSRQKAVKQVKKIAVYLGLG